jgi:hypothetical protein
MPWYSSLVRRKATTAISVPNYYRSAKSEVCSFVLVAVVVQFACRCVWTPALDPLDKWFWHRMCTEFILIPCGHLSIYLCTRI